MLRPHQCVKNMPGTPATYHLGNAFFAGWAINAARRARETVAVGATAIASRVLRKFAAGLGANGFKVRGCVFAEINVVGVGWSAEADDATRSTKSEEENEVTHARLPGPTPPPTIFKVYKFSAAYASHPKGRVKTPRRSIPSLSPRPIGCARSAWPFPAACAP